VPGPSLSLNDRVLASNAVGGRRVHTCLSARDSRLIEGHRPLLLVPGCADAKEEHKWLG
jgi:hypothetical protein